MTIYTLETKDPTFAGVTQSAKIEKSWSRGLLKKVYLPPMNRDRGRLAVSREVWSTDGYCR